MKMRTALLVFSICVIKIDLLDAQTKTAGCQNLQSGIFYNYPKREVNSSYSIFIRQGNIQKEVAMPAGDTSVWEVKWKNDCNYSLTYLYGEGPFAIIANGYKNKIIVDVKITESTDDYYTFETTASKKNHSSAISDTIWLKQQPSKLHQGNFKDASFPGGDEAWAQYLSDNLATYKKLGKSKKEGTCLVAFTVDVDGSVSNVKALTMRGSKIEKYSVEIIKNSPKWIPGTIDGQLGKVYKIQPVTFVIDDQE